MSSRCPNGFKPPFASAENWVFRLHVRRVAKDPPDSTVSTISETRRSNWNIKGIKCEAAFWDEGIVERHVYSIGEFERSYGEKAKIRIQYPGGMSAVDLAMMPIIVARLEKEHPDCTLHIRSIEDYGAGV